MWRKLNNNRKLFKKNTSSLEYFYQKQQKIIIKTKLLVKFKKRKYFVQFYHLFFFFNSFPLDSKMSLWPSNTPLRLGPINKQDSLEETDKVWNILTRINKKIIIKTKLLVKFKKILLFLLSIPSDSEMSLWPSITIG